jgi:hypothetical protein
MGALGRSMVVVVVVVVGATEAVVTGVVVPGTTEVVVGAGAVSAVPAVVEPSHAAAPSEIATVSRAVEMVAVFVAGMSALLVAVMGSPSP